MSQWAVGISRVTTAAALACAGLLTAGALMVRPHLDLSVLRASTPALAWRSSDLNHGVLSKQAAVAAALGYSERFPVLVTELTVTEFNDTLGYAVIRVDYEQQPSRRFLVHAQPDGTWRVIAEIHRWMFPSPAR